MATSRDIIKIDNSLQTVIYGTPYFNFKSALQSIADSGADTIADIQDVDKNQLERALHVNNKVVWVRLNIVDDDESAVMITVSRAIDDEVDEADVQAVVKWVRRRFWMDIDMQEVEKALDTDRYGNELIDRFFPIRPANYGGAWEAMMKSVVHAQIFPGFAKKLDIYLCERFGTVIERGDQTAYLYPTPEELLIAQPDELIDAKFSRQKADFLTTIPRQILDAPSVYNFDDMRERDSEDVVKTLKELHGVGDWTAQNVTMRGLPHADMFIDEKNTRKQLAPIYASEKKMGKREFRSAVERFKPYRTFACYYTYMRHFAITP